MDQRETKAVLALVERFDAHMRGAGHDPHVHAQEMSEALLGMLPVAWRMHALVLGLDPPTVDVMAEVVIIYRERAKVTAGIKRWDDLIDGGAVVQDFAPHVRASILELH